MIVERQTPQYDQLSIVAGQSDKVDCLALESVLIQVRNASGVGGTFSAIAVSPSGGVLWTIANGIALAVGTVAGIQLSSAWAGSGLAAAMTPAAGAYSTFLGLPPSIQINAVGINLAVNVIRRER